MPLIAPAFRFIVVITLNNLVNILPSLRTMYNRAKHLTWAPLFGVNEQIINQVKPKDTANSSTELNGTLNAIWDKGLTILFVLLTSIAVIVIIIAGIQYITAGGSPEKVKAARGTMINALVAVVLMISAYTILQIITAFTSFFATHLAS
jgi:hypothetical protein